MISDGDKVENASNEIGKGRRWEEVWNKRLGNLFVYFVSTGINSQKACMCTVKRKQIEAYIGRRNNSKNNFLSANLTL